MADPDAAARHVAILVVDDEPLICRSIAALLREGGHHVVTAGTAAEALAYARTGAPLELVVTDFAMPDMNGLQLAAAITAVRPRCPILLMSGYADREPGALGADIVFLDKPFTADELREAVHRALALTP